MKWQAVMLVVPKRIECGQCGGLALFVVLDDEEQHEEKTDYGYSAWCQDCWRKVQEG